MPAIIHTIDHGATGEHWNSMRPVDEYLRDWVALLDALQRFGRGDDTPDDLARLEFGGLIAPETDRGGNVDDWIASAFLTIDHARWSDAPGYCGNSALCRVELVTGTGGPHSEIVAHFARNGACERVEAHQYWSGHREAWSIDGRVLATVGEFCFNTLGLEDAA